MFYFSTYVFLKKVQVRVIIRTFDERQGTSWIGFHTGPLLIQTTVVTANRKCKKHKCIKQLINSWWLVFIKCIYFEIYPLEILHESIRNSVNAHKY